MGWKTAVIIASQRPEIPLAAGAVHNQERANQIAAALPGPYTLVGESSFEEGAYPSNGHLYIGAYNQAIILGDMELAHSCFTGKVPPVISVIESLLPGANVMALELHSVVNLYGYALFQDQKLVRLRAGSADDGVMFDLGEPLAEELPLFAQATVNAEGEQVWLEEYDGEVEELDHSSMGEEFVFEASKRFFGLRFDSFDHDRLKMSEYRTQKKTFWQRLTGK